MSAVIPLDRVLEKTTLGRSTIYNYMKQGRFPAAVRLSDRNVAWVEAEVDAWLQERIKMNRSTRGGA